jgi:hypothetical protein
MIPLLYMLPSVSPAPEPPRAGASPLPTGSSPFPSGLSRSRARARKAISVTRPPRISQLVLHPSGPIRRLMSGINQPERTMANPLPTLMNPAARPLLLLANQAEASPIRGTLVAPLPMPVIM